jgi:formylglycine-generating enzyme required for sulfatase activity
MKKAFCLMLLNVVMVACVCNSNVVSPNAPTEWPTQELAEPTTEAPPTDASLGDTWARSIDGMAMIYVPGDAFQMGRDVNDTDGGSDEFPQHVVTLNEFWIDRTEVSVAQFRRFVVETGYETEAEQEGWAYAWTGMEWGRVDGANWQHPQGPDSSAQEEHPVVQVSWNDAVAYCEWAGGRLPTEAEWEYAARGEQATIYPWGDEFDCSRGNFDDETEYDREVVSAEESCDGYVETSPTGHFPTGATWCGALDMAGNVYEWVADWYDENYYVDSPSQNPVGPETGEYKVLRGGGWSSNQRRVRTTDRNGLAPGDRTALYGFRCAVSLSGPTPTQDLSITPTLGPTSQAPPTDAALGDTWVRPIDQMVVIYVPGGTFPMGSEKSDRNAQSNEFPQHTIALDSFWLDQIEVSAGQFRQCIDAGACRVPLCDWGNPTNDDNPQDSQPVVCVNWHGAQAYCEWVGARLPTEAEWEYAARGSQGHIYPWGNDAPSCDRANYGDCVGGTTVTGSYPSGATWCGALDMAGNVWEWVADWYDENYYAESPFQNPGGPATGSRKILRGGSCCPPLRLSTDYSKHLRRIPVCNFTEVVKSRSS